MTCYQHIKLKPFKEKIVNIFYIINEFFVLAIALLVIIFLDTSMTEDEAKSFGWIMIGLVCLCALFNWGLILPVQIKFLCSKCIRNCKLRDEKIRAGVEKKFLLKDSANINKFFIDHYEHEQTEEKKTTNVLTEAQEKQNLLIKANKRKKKKEAQEAAEFKGPETRNKVKALLKEKIYKNEIQDQLIIDREDEDEGRKRKKDALHPGWRGDNSDELDGITPANLSQFGASKSKHQSSTSRRQTRSGLAGMRSAYSSRPTHTANPNQRSDDEEEKVVEVVKPETPPKRVESSSDYFSDEEGDDDDKEKEKKGAEEEKKEAKTKNYINPL